MKLLSLLNEELAYETKITDEKETTTLFYKKETGNEKVPVKIVFFFKNDENRMLLTIPNDKHNYGHRYKGNKAIIENLKNELDEAYMENNFEKLEDIMLAINNIVYDNSFPKKLRTEISSVLGHCAGYLDMGGGKLKDFKDAIEYVYGKVKRFEEKNPIIHADEKGPLLGEESSFRRIMLQLIKEKFDKNPNLVIEFTPSNDALERVYLATLVRAKYRIVLQGYHTYEIRKGQSQ